MGNKSNKKYKVLIFPRNPTSFDEYFERINQSIFFLVYSLLCIYEIKMVTQTLWPNGQKSEAFLKTSIVFHSCSISIKKLISNRVSVFISYKTINNNNSHSNHSLIVHYISGIVQDSFHTKLYTSHIYLYKVNIYILM